MFNPRDEFRLCYIARPFAYFTTANLTDQGDGQPVQWGDDWNDRPYQHNAGLPSAIEGEEIAVVCFTHDNYDEPADISARGFSVEDINSEQRAWLQPEYVTKDSTVIYAGDTVDEFVNKVESSGGTIWIDRDTAGKHFTGISRIYGG